MHVHTKSWTGLFTAGVFTFTPNWKTTQMFCHRWTDKHRYIHTEEYDSVIYRYKSLGFLVTPCEESAWDSQELQLLSPSLSALEPVRYSKRSYRFSQPLSLYTATRHSP